MASGFRHDLRGLCDLARRHGAALVVDAAQSAGAVRIDLAETPVDFLAAPTFKWLLGPLGAGFLHVRADWIERAPPPMIGWMAVTNPGDNDLRAIRLHPTAMRFERGVLDMVAFAGARAGLEILHRVGMERVESRILDLSDRLHGGLRALADKGVRLWTPPARAERAGIVAFDVPDRARLHGRLEADGIHTLDYLGHIRVDPSFYNTEEEIERLLEKLREWL
jgi:selenocysteine lyase/cysteine desulfurase